MVISKLDLARKKWRNCRQVRKMLLNISTTYKDLYWLNRGSKNSTNYCTWNHIMKYCCPISPLDWVLGSAPWLYSNTDYYSEKNRSEKLLLNNCFLKEYFFNKKKMKIDYCYWCLSVSLLDSSSVLIKIGSSIVVSFTGNW